MDDKDKRFQDGVAEETASRGAALPDEELPGFKINYNGSDESSEDDFAAREGDGGGNGVETAADVAEAVPMGDRPVENGSVAHGEGENKPVMLENESLGGLNETALKTAPGGLKTDSEGFKSDSARSIGEGQGITEAEARAMLIEDNARAKEDLKKANAKGRKTLVVVIILAVVLIIAGIAVSVILGGRDKDGNNDKQEGDGDENTAVVEKPEGVDESGVELVELSLDDEVVKRVYGNFQGISREFTGWWSFYIDGGVRDGKIDRAKMLKLAGANVWGSPCIGNYEYTSGGRVENECASGEAVRQKVAEMFGEHLELVSNDKLHSFCGDGMVYDVTNDEFYQSGIGCGGYYTDKLVRVLEEAEKEGDRMYIYERVAVFSDSLEYFRIGDEEILGEKIGEYTVPDYSTFQGPEDYNVWLEKNRNSLTLEYGDEFKWAFRLDEEGNYVFEGLEKVN